MVHAVGRDGLEKHLETGKYEELAQPRGAMVMSESQLLPRAMSESVTLLHSELTPKAMGMSLAWAAT